jgi:hypothetical protein
MRQTCYVNHNIVECYEYDNMNILISGHTLLQTPNAPYDSAVTQHQRNPGIGHSAGSGIH